MTIDTEKSIAETILSGEGGFDELLYVNNLNDGTCLVYEQQKLFGADYVVRVTRLDVSNGEELCGAVGRDGSAGKIKKKMRALNDFIMNDGR